MISCSGIRLSDIETPRPVPEGSCVVVGFLGGRDAWDDDDKGIRQVALRLRDPARHLYVETFENKRRDVAEAFVHEALHGAGDESESILIVYGQSFGGAATVKFARQLAKQNRPIRLTLQIDSVGRGDGEIPPNVQYAANLYQANGRFIKGENPIRACDPDRTRILGNWEFDYDHPPGSEISLDDLPWWKTIFRTAHAKMDRDERVWNIVEKLIRACCRRADLDSFASELPLPENHSSR
jgi:hypothetical protein